MKRYISGMFLAILMFVILLPMQARAEGGQFLLDQKTGTVTIRLPETAEVTISSLQFGFSIDAADADKVSFEFGESKAKITEFRYDESKKQLNVYMAGVESLFTNGSLTAGKVVIQDKDGNVVNANVSVVEDSLQYVNGTEQKAMDDVVLPGTVLVGTVPQPGQEPVTPTAQPGQETAAPTAGPGQEPAAPTAGPGQEPAAPAAGPGQEPAAPAAGPGQEPAVPTVQPGQEPAAPTAGPGQEPGSVETPVSGSEGEGNDPNAGWDPGWGEASGDNSQGNSSNSNGGSNAAQDNGGGNMQTAFHTSNKGTGTVTPKPSETPSASGDPAVPSLEPESDSSEPVEVGEIADLIDNKDQEEEEPLLSASASTGESGREENGVTGSGRKTNWILILAVIAIVIFATVAAGAVVVLNGKKDPHNRRN